MKEGAAFLFYKYRVFQAEKSFKSDLFEGFIVVC